MALNSEDLTRFDNDGILLVRSAFADAEIARMRAEADRVTVVRLCEFVELKRAKNPGPAWVGDIPGA